MQFTTRVYGPILESLCTYTVLTWLNAAANISHVSLNFDAATVQGWPLFKGGH